MLSIDPAMAQKPRPPFGRWLLAQQHRADPVGLLAQAAARDPRFPKEGDTEAVSRRLNQAGAEGDLHQALEDAELDYLCH